MEKERKKERKKEEKDEEEGKKEKRMLSHERLPGLAFWTTLFQSSLSPKGWKGAGRGRAIPCTVFHYTTS